MGLDEEYEVEDTGSDVGLVEALPEPTVAHLTLSDIAQNIFNEDDDLSCLRVLCDQIMNTGNLRDDEIAYYRHAVGRIMAMAEMGEDPEVLEREVKKLYLNLVIAGSRNGWRMQSVTERRATITRRSESERRRGGFLRWLR